MSTAAYFYIPQASRGSPAGGPSLSLAAGTPQRGTPNSSAPFGFVGAMAVCPRPRVNDESKEAEKEMREQCNSSETQRETAAREEMRTEENEHEVIVIKDDDDSTSDDSDAVGVNDLQFGRRAQPLRYSRATR